MSISGVVLKINYAPSNEHTLLTLFTLHAAHVVRKCKISERIGVVNRRCM